MRDKYAMFNTHITTVKGLTTEGLTMKKETLDVRFTSDSHETLSISNGHIQFSVDFKPIMKLIEETRKDKRTS